VVFLNTQKSAARSASGRQRQLPGGIFNEVALLNRFVEHCLGPCSNLLYQRFGVLRSQGVQVTLEVEPFDLIQTQITEFGENVPPEDRFQDYLGAFPPSDL
jgi:hypothetical protein